jgi:hypothetical protein
MDIAAKTQRAQALEKAWVEASGRLQPRDLLVAELQVLEIGKDLIQAGGHEVVAVPGQASDEELERRRFVHFTGLVSRHHRELVEVEQQHAFRARAQVHRLHQISLHPRAWNARAAPSSSQNCEDRGCSSE